jgi:glycerol-3-phosphate acyltransferase PlsY
MIIPGVFLLVFSYLIGSVATAVWVGKYFFNTDIRKHGSGNAGATNAFRLLGKTAGISVLAVDILKGLVAVMLPVYYFDSAVSPVLLENFRVLCGTAAVVGHVYPVFAGFKGGKGIATLLGVSIGIQPLGAAICIGVFVIVFLITHYVSLGSILAALCYAAFILFLEENQHDATTIFAIALPLAVLFTHRSNINRLMAGNEPRTYLNRPKE